MERRTRKWSFARANAGRRTTSGFAWCVAVVVASGCGGAEPAEPFDAEEARTSIRQVLEEQVAAWNRGDVEGFMEGYWRSDSLRFASGGDVRRGWQTTLEAYRRNYPDRAAMGTLAFEDLDVRMLSPSWAVVFGGWRLRREGGLPELSGLFTLLFERPSADAAWRIVHDHTSAATSP